ncbi:O-antigen ligase family protein [Planctomycetota bacterium]
MAVILMVTLLLIGASIVVGGRHYQFLPFILLCGPIRVSTDFGVGLNLSAVWMLCVIVFGCVVLANRLMLHRFELFEGLFLCFVLWCCIEVFRCDDLLMGARVLLKFAFPLLVILLGHFVQTPDFGYERTLKWLAVVCAVAVITTGGPTHVVLRPVADVGRLFFVSYAMFADYCAVMACLLLVCWRVFRKPWYLALLALVAISPVVFGIRTGILATAIGMSAFGIAVYRTRALAVIVPVYIAVCLALFAVPHVRDYMFFNPVAAADAGEIMQRPQEIDIDNINTNGRFAIWGHALKALWEPHPLIGSGTGQSQVVGYEEGFGGVRVIHSGYVRLLCDVGLIGLVLYVLSSVACLLRAGHLFRWSPSPTARWCALAVLCTFPAVLTCMAFDNVFDYALAAGQYPYAFAGMMLAAHRKGPRRNDPRSRRQPVECAPGAPSEAGSYALNRP